MSAGSSKNSFRERKERSDVIIIGSRGSDLALWQARWVQRKLRSYKVRSRIKIIKTQGDKIQNLSFDKLEGKGFFTKEIEEALLKGEIDLAIHSHKDLPTEPVPGLEIAAVSEREDPSELLLIRKSKVDQQKKFLLKHKAVVGTSSARRKSQLLAWRPDLTIKELRGNVPTRVNKLRQKKYDAILIAKAGVHRLKLPTKDLHCEVLDPHEFIPSPAQGVLAMQIRRSDKLLKSKLQKLNNRKIQEVIGVERKIMNLFDGGCQLPLGVHCERDGSGNFEVRISKAEAWNQTPLYFHFRSRNTKGLAAHAVNKIRRAGRKKSWNVFISREEKKNDLFRRGIEASGAQLTSRPMISIKRVRVTNVPKTPWIFFSSKNGVRHLFDQRVNVNGSKLAAVGKASAEELMKYGKKPAFVGSGSSIRQTGKEFARQIGKKLVLFPGAEEGLRSVQKCISPKQVKELAVYRSTEHANANSFNGKKYHVLIFTSPRNAKIYLRYNKIRKSQKVIAMGEATADFLKKNKVKVSATPPSFDDLGLLQALNQLI